MNAVFFLILLRKIKKNGIHSKYSLAEQAAKGLLRQPHALSGEQSALAERIARPFEAAPPPFRKANSICKGY